MFVMEVLLVRLRSPSGLLQICAFWFLLKVALCSSPVAVDASAVHVTVGGNVLLPCRSLPEAGTGPPHASWTRPHDARQVTRDSQVSRVLRDRARVIGNRSEGAFHLHILYAKFPDDNGTWWCDVFNGPRLSVTVTVLVPPAMPSPIITPFIGLVFKVTSEAWTFSCQAHHAHPPVSLTWSRLSGPEAPFSLLPPGGVASPDGTMSQSIDVTVTAVNNDSVFACQARHPTFSGSSFSTRVRFVVNDPTAAASAGILPTTAPLAGTRAGTFAPGDIILVAAGLSLLLVATCTAASLWRTSSRWELDVRSAGTYMQLSTSEITTTCILHSNRTSPLVSEKKGVEHWPDVVRRRCVMRLASAGFLLSVVIVTLTFVIAVYMRTFSLPIAGVDHVVPVMAGSLLWLDCSAVTGSGEDLLEVVWRKGRDPFYHQYPGYIGEPPLSTPANDTAETGTLSHRTRPHAMGQLIVWPAMTGDQGVYVCEVSRMLDDRGRTGYQRLTFAVLVMDGPQLSIVLLVLASVGLLSAVCLFGLGIYHSIRTRGASGNNKHNKEGAT